MQRTSEDHDEGGGDREDGKVKDERDSDHDGSESRGEGEGDGQIHEGEGRGNDNGDCNDYSSYDGDTDVEKGDNT